MPQTGACTRPCAPVSNVRLQTVSGEEAPPALGAPECVLSVGRRSGPQRRLSPNERGHCGCPRGQRCQQRRCGAAGRRGSDTENGDQSTHRAAKTEQSGPLLNLFGAKELRQTCREGPGKGQQGWGPEAEWAGGGAEGPCSPEGASESPTTCGLTRGQPDQTWRQALLPATRLWEGPSRGTRANASTGGARATPSAQQRPRQSERQAHHLARSASRLPASSHPATGPGISTSRLGTCCADGTEGTGPER